MTLSTSDFTYISSLLMDRSGLVVTTDKMYLLESRLVPIARRRELNGLEGLISQMRRSRDEKLINEVIEAMTTNESFFFRDKTPFDNLKGHILPKLMEARATRKTIRIWCAAASSGQEPYSIAMILKELGAKAAGWRFEIVGTDISNDVLDKARKGAYTQFEVQRGLPITMLVKYFTQEGDAWYIKDEVKKMVKFQKFNLLDNVRGLGQFDVVFCRNVLIYFNQETKGQVLERVRGALADDGALFLGAAETILGVSEKFKPVQGLRGVYEPNGK